MPLNYMFLLNNLNTLYEIAFAQENLPLCLKIINTQLKLLGEEKKYTNPLSLEALKEEELLILLERLERCGSEVPTEN